MAKNLLNLLRVCEEEGGLIGRSSSSRFSLSRITFLSLECTDSDLVVR